MRIPRVTRRAPQRMRSALRVAQAAGAGAAARLARARVEALGARVAADRPIVERDVTVALRTAGPRLGGRRERMVRVAVRRDVARTAAVGVGLARRRAHA